MKRQMAGYKIVLTGSSPSGRLGGALLVFFCLFLFGCVDDPFQNRTFSPDTEYTLRISLEGARALDAADPTDEAIEDLLFLSFDPAGGEFRYLSEATEITLSDTEGQLTVKVPLKVGAQEFFVLANAKSRVAELYPGGIPTDGTETKTSLQQALLLAKPFTNAASGWRIEQDRVPMWGKVTMTPVAGVTDMRSVVIPLLRMLAKIKVEKSAAISDQQFTLTGVYLYNFQQEGYLVPGGMATGPVPAPSLTGDANTKGPLRYAAGDSIYTFEAAKGSPSGHLTNTCLVIEGKYNGSTKNSYYRIDFIEKEGDYVALLRNHCYQVTITSVEGEGGEDSEEDAFKQVQINMKATVTPWNLATHNIIFDGQYTFSIGRNRLLYDQEAASHIVNLSTDHPSGITGVTSSESWLTLSAFTPGTQSGTFTATAAENTTGASRSATVTVTVGGAGGELVYTLSATQSQNAWLEWTNHQIYYTNGRTYNTANGNAPSITSIASWTATVTDANSILSSQTFTSGGAAGTTTGCSFSLAHTNDHLLYREAFVTFHDPEGNYPDKVYPVVNMENGSNSVSNCLVTTSTGSLSIPSAYRKAYAVWKYGDGVSGPLGDVSAMGTLSAKVLWQDVNGLISDANISYNSSTDVITIGSLSASAGNVVVALQAGGTTVWSWHIWKPTTAPGVLNGWMDRHLGAINNTPGNVGAIGLMYQWGRKDPFPGANVFATYTSTTKASYNGAGGMVYGVDRHGSPYQHIVDDNNLAHSIRNPFTFYYDTANPYALDWYTIKANTTAERLKFQNDYLWIGKVRDKMPFDPCPVGYRTPQRNDWDTLNTSNFPWTNNGRTAASHGGYYPAAGSREFNDGILQPSNTGRVWSGDSDVVYRSIAFQFSGGGATYASMSLVSAYRSLGCSVRCRVGE